jgi:hypothetical protein
MERLCLDCNAPIKGRADKRFCDDLCRSNFHNQSKAEELVFLKQINQILKKNREILKNKTPMGKVRVKKEMLIKKGFDFGYHTHIYSNSSGMTYFFCYEYGYVTLRNGEILVVKRDHAHA